MEVSSGCSIYLSIPQVTIHLAVVLATSLFAERDGQVRPAGLCGRGARAGKAENGEMGPGRWPWGPPSCSARPREARVATPGSATFLVELAASGHALVRHLSCGDAGRRDPA